MASISKERSGYRVQFYDAGGERRGVRLPGATKRQAELIAAHVEHLNVARITTGAVPTETARWVADLEPKLYAKLVKVGLAERREQTGQELLGPFLDDFITSRESSQAPRTIINWRHARESLVVYFGADKPLRDITIADAGAWRRWMATNPEARKIGGKTRKGAAAVPLAPNTYNRRCGFARQFFAEAVDARLIAENPFRKLKGIAVRANKARDFHLSREDAAKVLDACPGVKWRLIFALARFGGLRCPCEHKALTWGDVDWAKSRIRIDSPKTGERFIPIFPELRPHLEDALAVAGDAAIDDPATPVVDHPRGASWNFATHLARIARKAGLKPWPKIFQNLRLTRETELAGSFPIHVVCEWIGNSQAVAKEHYLRATDADFERGAGPSTEGRKMNDWPALRRRYEAAEIAKLPRMSARQATLSLDDYERLAAPSLDDFAAALRGDGADSASVRIEVEAVAAFLDWADGESAMARAA